MRTRLLLAALLHPGCIRAGWRSGREKYRQSTERELLVRHTITGQFGHETLWVYSDCLVCLSGTATAAWYLTDEQIHAIEQASERTRLPALGAGLALAADVPLCELWIDGLSARYRTPRPHGMAAMLDALEQVRASAPSEIGRRA